MKQKIITGKTICPICKNEITICMKWAEAKAAKREYVEVN